MIGSLLYLTASHLDIILSICLCAGFQGSSKESPLMSIRQILRYLADTRNLRLWYPQRRDFSLVGYTGVDYTGYKVD